MGPSDLMNVYINQFNTATDRNLLPLAAGLICSYAKSDGDISNRYHIEIKMLRESPDKTVAEYEDPRVIAFSCCSWNYKHSLEVARLAKLKFPRALIIVGGPSIPRKPETLEPFFKKFWFVDVAVHGEGEITFAMILKALARGDDLSNVAGLSYRSSQSEKQYVKTLERPRITNLDILPSPYLDGTFDALLNSHRDVITGTIWETNRGCPFSCTFCDWGQATQAKITTYAIDRLYKELDWISENKIFYVYAADGNFGIKNRDIEIASYMGSLKTSQGFPGFLMINWTKNSQQKTIDIADTLLEAGIGCQVTLSMQSFSDETLEAVKRSNIDLDTFLSLKSEYNKRNIATYSELLLGLPGETYESFCSGVIRALSPFPRDGFNIYLCRILENSEMSESDYREKYAIETRWCEVAMARRRTHYATVNEDEEIIVATSSMSVADWRKSFNFGYLLSTFSNLKIAHVVINYLHYQLNLPIQEYIEFLLEHAPDSSGMCKEVVEHLTLFQESILASKYSVLPVEGFGGRDWEPHESTFLLTSKNPEGFYEHLKELTEAYIMECSNIAVDKLIIQELFRFQSLLSPLNHKKTNVIEKFRYDWLKFYCDMARSKDNTLTENKEPLVFSPPKSYCEDFIEFITTQVSSNNSDSQTSCWDVKKLSHNDARLLAVR